MKNSWTDERLDDFRTEVNRRFEAVDRRFDVLDARIESGFGKSEAEFHRINDRLDSLTKAIVYSTSR